MSDAMGGGVPPVEAMDEWFLGFVMQHGGEAAVRAYLQSRMLDARGLPWVLRPDELSPEERRARAELWLRSARTCRDRLGLSDFDVECRLGLLHDAVGEEEVQPEAAELGLAEDPLMEPDELWDDLLVEHWALLAEEEVQAEGTEVGHAEDRLVQPDELQDDHPGDAREQGEEEVLAGSTGPKEKGESAEARASAVRLGPEGFESTEEASK